MSFTALVVPWHRKEEIDEFKDAWKISDFGIGKTIFLQQDEKGEGCAVTKNKGIQRAYDSGAHTIVVLDGDCYPEDPNIMLSDHFAAHREALKPQKVRLCISPTNPSCRGMPYRNHHIEMPVAASMGFWHKYPDLDAVSSLVIGEQPEMGFLKIPVHGRYFPFCGMNFAFRRQWINEAQLINVPRWDDIWMGWIWQKIAYEMEYCFNLNGPMVNHMRQSNVWKNLAQETPYMEINENLWAQIHKAPRNLPAKELRAMIGLSTVGAPLPPSADIPTDPAENLP